MMFEKIKKIIRGKQVESVENTGKREDFPAENEGIETAREEFRKIIEEQKPKEVYARRFRFDDYGTIGTFYVCLKDKTVIRVDDYYPPMDAAGNITITHLSPVGILDNLPYREILREPHPTGNSLYFKAKYLLKD